MGHRFSRRSSSLALFMLGIARANNAHNTLPADHFAVLADRLYAASNLHFDISTFVCCTALYYNQAMERLQASFGAPKPI
jgi:hypothetical protein